MSKLFKTLSFLLILAMVSALMLAGCGSQKAGDPTTAQDGNTSSAAATSAAAETKEELPPVELTWYTFASPQTDFDAVIAKFSEAVKAKINATVKIVPMDYGTYEAQMPVKIATKEEFDLCFTSHWLNNYKDNAVKGGYMAIDELLDKYAPKLKATYTSDMLDAMRVEGKLYGLFNQQQAYTQRGYWLKKDLVEKYGFDPASIKKYTDIEPFFDLILKNEKGITPFALDDKGVVWAFYDSLGFVDVGNTLYMDLKDPSLTLKRRYERSEVEKVVREWVKKGYIRKDAVTIKDANPEVKAGKYAAGIRGGISPSTAADFKRDNGFEAIIVPISEPILDSYGCLSTMTAISATSKNPERAMMLMELVNTDPEIFDIYAYGIKDKHYKLTDGLVEIIPDSGYTMGEAWAFGSLLVGTPRKDFTAEQMQQIRDLNKTARKSPVAGFTFQQAVVQTEYDNLTSINTEYGKGFSCGALDYDKKWPEFVEKLKAAGVEKVIEEETKQFNEFLASKK